LTGISKFSSTVFVVCNIIVRWPATINKMENINSSTEQIESKPFFTPEESRVVACLMEKQLTTPDYYPLTINALTTACNQKSNREPVMSLSEGQVGHIANVLAERGLVKVEYGDRANRISHCMKEYFSLNRAELAALNVLMLRKPLTLNDIQRRTTRMVAFEDQESVQLVLDTLIAHEQHLVVLLPPTPGLRGNRYAHTLCGNVSTENLRPAVPIKLAKDDDRLRKLEDRVTSLEATLLKLINKIGV